MVGPYPGIRRRHQAATAAAAHDDVAEGSPAMATDEMRRPPSPVAPLTPPLPPAPSPAVPMPPTAPSPRRRRPSFTPPHRLLGQTQQYQQQQRARTSHLYCLASALVALLAVVTSTAPRFAALSPALAPLFGGGVALYPSASEQIAAGGGSGGGGLATKGSMLATGGSGGEGKMGSWSGPLESRKEDRARPEGGSHNRKGADLLTVEHVARAAAAAVSAGKIGAVVDSKRAPSHTGGGGGSGEGGSYFNFMGGLFSRKHDARAAPIGKVSANSDEAAVAGAGRTRDPSSQSPPATERENDESKGHRHRPLLWLFHEPSEDTKPRSSREEKVTNGNGDGQYEGDSDQKETRSGDGDHIRKYRNPLKSFLLSLVDPSIVRMSPGSTADVLDKILSSTPRLLAIANLLLAVTYLLHTAVADLFLGAAPAEEQTRTHRRAGRERLGGFLVFKLLLVSAVVEPDTLDLLILLSWYTLLSFLRSLAHLAGAAASHAAQSGQPPRPGVFRLLLVVLLFDATAAASCAALFHGAGWSMVLLLSCDCALLGVDALCHIARHGGQVLEDRHAAAVAVLEDWQLRLHAERREREEEATVADNVGGDDHSDSEGEVVARNQEEEEEEEDESIDAASRRIDREMELLEASHARRLAFLENLVFALELFALGLTVCHFLHIWSLHGVSFGLVDGVLALHLHSAISTAGRKITERRNLNRIARDLDSFFEDATELEMRKASAAGDVCCICLGTMSLGNVKKVGCGHLYHTHCLREVVERARSIEGARCPLCRASVVNGSHIPSQAMVANNGVPVVGNNGDLAVAAGAGTNGGGALGANQDQQQGDNANALRGGEGQQPMQQLPINQGEHALFRFSTEGILPAWLPLPAFSFEVVRRPTLNPDVANNTNVEPQQQQQVDAAVNQNVANPRNNDLQSPPEQQQHQSFWRRLLVLAGAPMTPEEEATALEQLVDMFPQFERADLLRELRDRGSAEAVVEAVLAGVFSGVARGGGVGALPVPEPPRMEAEEALRDGPNINEQIRSGNDEEAPSRASETDQETERQDDSDG